MTDDMTDDVFREEQRTAMIDWLHWGGQLVVSGPGSLEMLKNSFLSDYLPAESTGNVELDADQLRQLHFVRGNGRFAAARLSNDHHAFHSAASTSSTPIKPPDWRVQYRA